MEPSTCRVLLIVLIAAATVTDAMNYLALPRMGRSGYIALPRMGRGYIAFPRMGRGSGPDGGEGAGGEGGVSAPCCPVGLKTEWLLSAEGKTSTQNVCQEESCCAGLQEILDQKPDGAFYSLCVPSSPAASADIKSSGSGENVLRKLNGLLRN